jgi:N-methylhydantoinase A
VRGGKRGILAIDTGGTFTDVMLLDGATGQMTCVKTPSAADDPSRGFAAGIGAALDASRLTGAEVARVLHGTTIATNLILEGKGAPAALITSAGFKYVLEIGRQDVPRRASLFAWVKPKRPLAPEHIFEVGGRMAPDGSELAPLVEGDVLSAARAIGALGIESVAIVLLHSYANPAHERRVADILAAELPRLMLSLSSEVLPVFREYERSMTTVLNAKVMPVMSAYIARLDRRLAELGVTAPLLLMKSSGGVTSTRVAQRVPAETALSGPAAGVVGASVVGAAAGYPDLIGIDIGGTSADVSLICGGEPPFTTNGRIGEWPLGLPMIDLVTIGAGGGSIARVGAEGHLRVGPDSAGALPGPACYGKGGAEPTVTDAHLVLGHLPPYLLGGSFRLDPQAARAAIRSRIAEPLAVSIEEAARGILEIVDNNMVGAIRVLSVERGHDTRAFALLPFGGAGPLHGGALARLIGARRIVIPPRPGVLSALGLLAAHLKREFARTALQRPGAFDRARVATVFAQLEREALAWFDDEQVPEPARRIAWFASLRYLHQGFELNVPWAGREASEAAAAATVAAFHTLHERLYTFAQQDTPVEIVTLRVHASGVFSPPPLPRVPNAPSLAAARLGAQTVHFAAGAREAAVYRRDRLGAGNEIAGPAIVTQLDATTLLLPDQVAVVDEIGSLIIAED